VIPTVPLAARNRLATLVVAAVADRDARAELGALARADVPPAGWLAADAGCDAGALLARARAAARALDREPLGLDREPLRLDREPLGLDGEPLRLGREPQGRLAALADALAIAAALFDAGLGFEVHEILEPHWETASAVRREALQGLIQVAVGYQHAANGNESGARALLTEGARRLEGGGLPGLDLARFAAAVRASVATGTFAAPRFPRVVDGRIE
jgi:hypothetical protein